MTDRHQIPPPALPDRRRRRRARQPAGTRSGRRACDNCSPAVRVNWTRPPCATRCCDLHEFWLTTKATEIGITATSGFAIVATGGLGRGELVPYSDLDLMLLHDNMPDDVVSEVAESLWYPLWDANIRLDHSVRTVPEALKVAGEDISAGPGDARSASHRRRRRAVGTADRRRAPAVAHRNRLAFRRTRRTDPGAVAAQRPDRPPRRAGPEDAAAAGCATCNCSTRWRSPSWPTSIRAGRLASPTGTLGERAPGAAQRAHRTAPGVRPGPGAGAGPARRRDRRGAAHR